MMRALVITAWMVCASTVAGEAVTLAWDASPDSAHVAGYRVHYGTVSGDYLFATNAGPALTQTVVLPYPGDWFFAVTAVGTNQLESDFSNEVMWHQALGAPVLHGDEFVRLTPLIERSTNQVDWVEFAGVPTYMPATNDMELFRSRRLAMDRIDVVGDTSNGTNQGGGQ